MMLPLPMIQMNNVGSTIVNHPPYLFFLRGGVASQLLIFGPNSPHKSKRQIKTIQPQLNEKRKRKKKWKKPCEPKKMFIIVRIYTYL